MRAYFTDTTTGEILECIDYDVLTSSLFKYMCTSAMEAVKDDMRSDYCKEHGTGYRWTIGRKNLECYCMGEGYYSRLELVNFDKDRYCLLRDRF